jgi:hypothetical protein
MDERLTTFILRWSIGAVVAILFVLDALACWLRKCILQLLKWKCAKIAGHVKIFTYTRRADLARSAC